jgi:DNA invertase Pin-like site-specific DNA recombinase
MMTAHFICLPTLEVDPETGHYDSPSAPKRRVRKLTSDQRADVRRLASTQSLRELASNFGVSHETIRSVLRSTPVEAVAAD